MTRKILLLIIIFTLTVIHECNAGEFTVEGNDIIVTATGTGHTLNEARIDARRNASQKALGFITQAHSLLKILNRSENVHERIMLITRGIIAGNEEELERHEDKERKIFTVTIRVKVRGDELLRGLIQREPEKLSADGSSIVAGAMRREQMKTESVSALTELLSSFPVGDYVKVSTSDAGNFDIKTDTLNMNLNLTFDRTRYFNEAVPAILSVLDYVSEARITDIPFILPSELADDGTITIRPSQDIRTLKDYRILMGIESHNRIIRGAGYANIYVQTRNYYFNAYRISHEAFIELVKNIFVSGINMNHFMRMNGISELSMKITNRDGMNVFTMSAATDITNIMYFMNTDDDTLLHDHKDNISDERQCALFILPAFGFDNGTNNSYVLCRNDSAELPNVKISADNLMGSSANSYIIFRRAENK